jgi:hypothetical protein
MKTAFFSLIMVVMLSGCLQGSAVVITPTLPVPAPTFTTAPSPIPTHTLMPTTPTKAMTSSPMPEGTVRVEIFADQEWQSAGMIVKFGQSITIQASGNWKHVESEVFYGPGGIEGPDTNSVLPSAPLGSLLGRIEGGQPFEIGSRTTWVADRAGRLYLSMNDRIGMYGDNHGSLVVQLGLNACGAGWSRLSTGTYAVVTDESSDPNRVRSAPDTSAEIIHQLYPGSIVRVLEGPVCAKSLIFWKVENESIPGDTGWTAEGNGSDYYMEPYPPRPPGSSTSQPVTTSQLMVAGGTYFDSSVGVTGTGFVFHPALTDGRTIHHIDIQGPPGWNTNKVFPLYPYQPSQIAEDRAIGWVFAKAVSGLYTATAEIVGGGSVSTTFVIDTSSQLPAPEILSVAGSTSQVRVEWSGTSDMHSFLLRLEKEPYSTDTSVITETIVAGEQRSLTFRGLSLTNGAEHRVVIFAFSNDLYTPRAMASPANFSAYVSETFTP